jgi:hypothetical protein
MKIKFIKPDSMLWNSIKLWIKKLFRKRDGNDNFFDNPYTVL